MNPQRDRSVLSEGSSGWEVRVNENDTASLLRLVLVVAVIVALLGAVLPGKF